MYTKEDKIRYIEVLSKNKGLVSYACVQTGIARRTIYKWLTEDEDFKALFLEVRETCGDWGERMLMDRMQEGDTNAIKFFLAKKYRDRGYGEQPVTDKVTQIVNEEHPQPLLEQMSQDINKQIRSKKAKIIKLLKAEGKYTNELEMQVDVVAQLQVRADRLKNEVYSPNFQYEIVQISREGNERRMTNPKVKEYEDCLMKVQQSLKALGMNTDAKERKVEDDGLSNFLDSIKEED